jgi:hypothetical protein
MGIPMLSKAMYLYTHLRRVGSVYEATLCRDENIDCENLLLHGVLLEYEQLSKAELGEEVSINARSTIFIEWSPCRTRRYLLILLDQ